MCKGPEVGMGEFGVLSARVSRGLGRDTSTSGGGTGQTRSPTPG